MHFRKDAGAFDLRFDLVSKTHISVSRVFCQRFQSKSTDLLSLPIIFDHDIMIL